jgi:hypothetical protein
MRVKRKHCLLVPIDRLTGLSIHLAGRLAMEGNLAQTLSGNRLFTFQLVPNQYSEDRAFEAS